MSAVQRRSPGIIGIAFAIVLGLLMFTVCVPVCTTACGIAGLATIVGIGASQAPEYSQFDPGKENRTPDEAREFSVESEQHSDMLAAQPEYPAESKPESEERIAEEPAPSNTQEPEASSYPAPSDMTQEYEKALDRVLRNCPGSLMPEETSILFAEFAAQLFAGGSSRRDVIRDLRRKVKGDGWTYNMEMRKCLAGIVSLAQEANEARSAETP